MSKRTKIKIFALIAIVLVAAAVTVWLLFFNTKKEPDVKSHEVLYQGDSTKINKTPEQAETFVVGSSRIPLDYRPYMHETEVGYAISHLVYEPLVDVTPEGDIKPVLAESVTFSSDGLTASVTLKDTVFSDGSKLTAEDVVKSYEVFFNADSPYYAVAKGQVLKGYYEYASGAAEKLEGIKVISGSVIEFEFSTVSAKNIYVLDVPVVKEIAGGYAVGTGEYVIDEIKPSVSASLKRNEKSTSNNYSYKGFVFKSFSADELDKAIKSFDIDLFFTNTNSMLDSIKEGGYHNVYRMRDTAYSYIGFNLKTVMGQSENVRKAIAYSLDRSKIGSAYYQDYVTAMGTVSTLKTKNSFDEKYKQDLAAAEEYLNKAVGELTEVMALPVDVVDDTKISVNYLCQNDAYSHGFYLNMQEALLAAKISLTITGVNETEYTQTLASAEGFDVYHKLNYELSPLDVIESTVVQNTDINNEYRDLIKSQCVNDYTKLLNEVETFVDDRCLIIPTFTDDYYIATLSDVDSDLILPLVQP